MTSQFECEQMHRKTKLSKHFSKMLESNIKVLFHKCYALVRISNFKHLLLDSKLNKL